VLTLGGSMGCTSDISFVMKTVVDRARAINAVPTVITFEPHPRAVLHPESQRRHCCKLSIKRSKR
jgi:riboflavin kinase/FMN adenylyltransferase